MYLQVSSSFREFLITLLSFASIENGMGILFRNETCLLVFQESLSDKVAMFNQYASQHKDKQDKNPFTSGLNLEKRKFTKEEYGR